MSSYSTAAGAGVLERRIFVATFAALGNTPAKVGSVAVLRGHTVAGLGGDVFQAYAGAVTNDGGNQINSATPDIYWERVKKNFTTVEDFGYAGSGDASDAMNKACALGKNVFLRNGHTYRITKGINLTSGCHLIGSQGTKIECYTNRIDNRFESASAIRSEGINGGSIYNTGVTGVDIYCEGLLQNTGSFGILGLVNYKTQGFYNRNVRIFNCRSYAFWAFDEVEFTDYASGIYENCEAIDASISFEQVNTRGVTLINCHAWQTGQTIPYPVYSMFHPYGGEDLRVVYLNCSAKGVAGAIVEGGLHCKNVKFINCDIEQLASTSVAVIFSGASSNENDRISFEGGTITAVGNTAVSVSCGDMSVPSVADNRIAFSGVKIIGKPIGATVNGNGRFTFTDCDITGETNSTTQTPYAIYTSSTTARLQIIGGSLKAVGTKAVNTINTVIETVNTLHTPAVTKPFEMLQEKVGEVTLIADSGTKCYANITVSKTITNISKCNLSVMVRNIADTYMPIHSVSWSWLQTSSLRIRTDGLPVGTKLSYRFIETY